MGTGGDASDPRRMTSSTQILVRPVTPADAALLQDAFDHLSLESRRRRFHSAGVRLTNADAQRLATVDHQTNEALAAIEPVSGAIVGVASYAALVREPGVAEVAVAVVDDWQRQGIGRELVHVLLEHASANGFDRVIAYVDAENNLVLDWLARAGAVASPGQAGLYTLAIEPTALRRAA
jgi:RimJ/RimL family protein N-acetyltransferase